MIQVNLTSHFLDRPRTSQQFLPYSGLLTIVASVLRNERVDMRRQFNPKYEKQIFLIEAKHVSAFYYKWLWLLSNRQIRLSSLQLTLSTSDDKRHSLHDFLHHTEHKHCHIILARNVFALTLRRLTV